MHSRYSKTDAGRAEIKSRALPLSRHARNLLLIIDGTRPVTEWMALVHGCGEDDVQMLAGHGLIEAAAAPAPTASSRPAASREPTIEQIAAAMSQLGYSELYTLLTAQAKERLGLIKGYKFILDVERCTNLSELQSVAERFLHVLREEHGDAGVKHVRQALGMAV